MNPRKIDLLNGVRLAFAQGGPGGFKLVLLTDPIETISHGDFAEAKWSPANRPFKYSQAPLLIKNSGESDFPLLRHFIAPANCPSWEAKFAGKFRARRMPLDTSIAEEIIRVFDQRAASGNPELFASVYVDALPYSPPKIDDNRRQTYFNLLGKLLENDEACKLPYSELELTQVQGVYTGHYSRMVHLNTSRYQTALEKMSALMAIQWASEAKNW
jgi:hypothetical protein